MIIKEFPCENKRQAEAEDDKIMHEMKASLNVHRAYQTPEERREQLKVNSSILRGYDLEKYKEYNKEYYNEHKTQIKERAKEYQQKNSEEIK